MGSDKDDFRTLLNYFVAHSKEHAEEFIEMANKAKLIGEKDIHKAIMDGVEKMNRATEAFESALEMLG